MFSTIYLSVILIPCSFAGLLHNPFETNLSIVLTGDDDVVIGGTLFLTAHVYGVESGKFIYEWKDLAIPQHRTVIESESTQCSWNVTYDQSYYPGRYLIEVRVDGSHFFWTDHGRTSVEVNVRPFLAGGFEISQLNTTRQDYVSTNGSAEFGVSLVAQDARYVEELRPYVVTYWFHNCNYLGPQTGMKRAFNFSRPEETQYIEALVVASVPPPPPPTTTPIPPTPSTTTTTVAPTTLAPNGTTTSTTAAPSTTSTSTATSPTSTTTKTTSIPPRTTSTTAKPFASNSTTVSPSLTMPDSLAEWLKTMHAGLNGSQFCLNMSQIPLSPNASTYGIFRQKVITKAPVSSVQINGSNWLKEGDFLKLGISCCGSGPFSYCVQLMQNASYNVTGHERCDPDKTKTTNDCTLVFGHLLPKPKEYKLLFIISNAVNTLVTPVGVVVYQVAKQPQISIIIVPVASAIVATVLVVFGVAYYVHTRRTYTIEVADFDFGQQSSDMEYKTFSERLREAVLASFFRTSVDDVDSTEGWSPTRKYGSMQESRPE